MSKELAIVQISEEKYPQIFKEGGLQDFIDQAKDASKEVPDLTTIKGRDRVKKLAADVSRSKKAVVKAIAKRLIPNVTINY